MAVLVVVVPDAPAAVLALVLPGAPVGVLALVVPGVPVVAAVSAAAPVEAPAVPAVVARPVVAAVSAAVPVEAPVVAAEVVPVVRVVVAAVVPRVPSVVLVAVVLCGAASPRSSGVRSSTTCPRRRCPRELPRAAARRSGWLAVLRYPISPTRSTQILAHSSRRRSTSAKW